VILKTKDLLLQLLLAGIHNLGIRVVKLLKSLDLSLQLCSLNSPGSRELLALSRANPVSGGSGLGSQKLLIGSRKLSSKGMPIRARGRSSGGDPQLGKLSLKPSLVFYESTAFNVPPASGSDMLSLGIHKGPLHSLKLALESAKLGGGLANRNIIALRSHGQEPIKGGGVVSSRLLPGRVHSSGMPQLSFLLNAGKFPTVSHDGVLVTLPS